MKGLLSWVIANIWSIVLVSMILLFEIRILFIAGSHADNKTMTAILGPVLLFMGRAVVGGVPAITKSTNIVNNVVLVVGTIVAYVLSSSGNPDYITNSAKAYLVGSIVGILFAIPCAIFVFGHIEDVISRRMKYVNSNTGLLSYKIEYTVNRFTAVWGTITYVCFILYVH